MRPLSSSSFAKFSSVQPFDRVGRRRDMKDDPAEVLFQSLSLSIFFFLREAIVSSSSTGADVHSSKLSIPTRKFSADHGVARLTRCPVGCSPEGFCTVSRNKGNLQRSKRFLPSSLHSLLPSCCYPLVHLHSSIAFSSLQSIPAHSLSLRPSQVKSNQL